MRYQEFLFGASVLGAAIALHNCRHPPEYAVRAGNFPAQNLRALPGAAPARFVDGAFVGRREDLIPVHAVMRQDATHMSHIPAIARRIKSSTHVRQPVEQLVERNRIIAHTDSRGVVGRVGDRRATPQMPSSATPLAFIGDDIGSVSSRKITSWCGMSAWTGTS
jgi:hypothetical protein